VSIRQLATDRRSRKTLRVAARRSATTERLVGALCECGVRARHVEPVELSGLVRKHDGVRELRRVERRGIRVLNPARSLIARHRERLSST